MMEETIAAVATALREGGISVIRISGPQAFAVADRIFAYPGHPEKRLADQQSHTIQYGYIHENGTKVDEVLALLFRAPRSFTAEDTVEIDCHGGVYITQRILRLILKNGARLADPGEFTKRAFLNGRLDLSQAEAVADLIASENEFALQSSLSQLQGSVAETVHQSREEILDTVAFIEAALDDPEHLSLPEKFEEELLEKLRTMTEEIDLLLRHAKDGKLLTEGIRTVLLGKPNAGKSSILNLLCGEERAIVTQIPGTTRDSIEETVRMGELSLKLMDTAGIRESEDLIERMGVEKSRKLADQADLILYVCDSTLPLDEEEKTLIASLCEKRVIYLLNKSDQEAKITERDLQNAGGKGTILLFSAKNGLGRAELEDEIKRLFHAGEIRTNEQLVLTNDRQAEAFSRARESLMLVESSVQQEMPEDFYTIDLMNAYAALGEILGEDVDEDLVNRIFSRFCMGK